MPCPSDTGHGSETSRGTSVGAKAQAGSAVAAGTVALEMAVEVSVVGVANVAVLGVGVSTTTCGSAGGVAVGGVVLRMPDIIA